MSKLWDKGAEIDARIVNFTVGEDPILDLKLIKYDCQASAAHAEMLGKIGILTVHEVTSLKKALKDIENLVENGKFVIQKEQEDGHTAIENYLTEQLGETGQKIHTARSRNDQVLTALRLYYKAELDGILTSIKQLTIAINNISAENGEIPLPGFTHTRKAMPASVEMWCSAFVDSMKDNRRLLKFARKLVDQNPMGTGAGFGIPLEIDRELTTEIMDFAHIQKNPMYAQNSRGKFESTILHALSQVMIDLNKMATDLIFLSLPEFGCVDLPEALCTGSSIMPQKQNPDVLELVRSCYHTVQANEIEIKSRAANLISGYHRDMQLSKGPVMRSFQITLDALEMMTLVIEKLRINEANCRAAMTPELYATEAAYNLVKKGMPFREAYRTVGAKYRKK
ncbi:MAG: argininosuccinate lyase [Calditrichaeota bacterium]|nr:argininosuccinate lyase [Calditrichota bacterium]